MKLYTVPTPAFLVDKNVVERNCSRMREKALRSNVSYRPHVKTHKTIEIARMQHGGAIGPITVSTLAEAEFFADDGYRDITYAVPIVSAKLARAAELAARIDRLNVLVDSEETLREMGRFHESQGTVFDIFLKIDCGYHRAGLDPGDPASRRLAITAGSSPALRLHGLLTHAGHSYHARSVDEILAIAEEETGTLTRFRAGITGAGFGSLIRSVGSTPTSAVVSSFRDCDEVRPGNYVFYDAMQATLGSCAMEDVAVSVLTSVVGSYPDRGSLIVDAGALSLSKDAGPDHIDRDFGFGIVCDENRRPLALKIVALSQEHGKIAGSREAIAALPVGSRLLIIPNHSCLTSAMYDRYHVIEGGEVVAEWKPVRGW